ncbi:MAG: hypothetical protein IPH44_19630 [Myxococcales bacterium]|nr:hypothetical protein [Myxococcales bacterium]MBK7195061.1 hypothetical protein [Myxococcales bacterium]MBP6846730.1 hypothetical protein [Kofleriaceae bacterium]
MPRMPNPTRPARRSIAWPAIALLALGLAAGGCKSKPDDAPASPSAKPGAATKASGGALGGACDRREREKVCAEYRGAYAKPARIEEECAAQKAPFLAAGCPKDGAVGRCTRGAGTASQTDTLFYAPMTRETVTAMCTDGVVGDA